MCALLPAVSKARIELLHKFLYVKYGYKGKDVSDDNLKLWMGRILEINPDRGETFRSYKDRLIREKRIHIDENSRMWVLNPDDYKDWVEIASKEVENWEKKKGK